MTKSRYFEMMDQLGKEPDPSQTPVDFSDLYPFSQSCIELFNLLPDRYEGMSGTYMGKDYSCLGTFLDVFEIEDRKLCLLFLTKLDGLRSKELNRKKSHSKKKR